MILDILERRYQAALDQLTSETVPAYNPYPSFVPRAQLIAEIYGLVGNAQMEKVFYDSARATVEARLRESPDDDRLYSALGIALAGLGRKDDAILAGERAVELMPVEKEAWRGSSPGRTRADSCDGRR